MTDLAHQVCLVANVAEPANERVAWVLAAAGARVFGSDHREIEGREIEYAIRARGWDFTFLPAGPQARLETLLGEVRARAPNRDVVTVGCPVPGVTARPRSRQPRAARA